MRESLMFWGLLLASVCRCIDVFGAPNEANSTLSAAALSDPARWRFIGADAFPVKQLRDALASNVDVIVASRSSEAIDHLIEVVTRELRLGYLSVGYPDAVVTADVDAETRQLIVTIDEGKLFRQGKVEVRGATSIDVDRLITSVKEKYAPADAVPVFEGIPDAVAAPLRWLKANGQHGKLNDAIWNPGKPAAFVPSVWKTYEPNIQLFLMRQGYADPVVAATVEKAEDGTATFVITIHDEGPRVVLGEIEVTGNERNSTEDILEYLNLKEGQPFDAIQRARVHWQLKQAARFLKHDVQLSPPPLGSGPSRLILKLIEAPRVPTLKEEFTPIQQVAIRAANWLSTQKEFDWEILFRGNVFAGKTSDGEVQFSQVKSGSFRCLVSPKEHSTLFELEATGDDNRVIWGQVLCAGLNSRWLLAPYRKSKIEWSDISKTTTFILQLKIDVNPPDAEGRMVNLMFGAGVNGGGGGGAKDRDPIREEISISPLAMILDVTKEDRQVELTDEKMTVRGPDFEMEIDSQTGRLIKWDFGTKDDGSGTWHIRLEKNLHAEAIAKYESVFKESQNQYQRGAPVTSLLQYVCEEARSIEKLRTDRLPIWVRMAERIINSGALRVVDEGIANLTDDDDSESTFAIPIVPNPKSPLGVFAWLDPMIRALLTTYAKVFRATPGWTIGREATLMVLQPQGVPIPPPFVVSNMLEADHAGPVHYLAAAKLFGLFSPGHQIVLSNAGLRLLTPEAFRLEVAACLNGDGAASQTANTIADLLQNLDESDLDDLAETLDLSADNRALVARLLKQLIRRRNEPVSVLLPELAEEAWPVFQPRVKSELRKLAVPPATPQRQPQRVTEKPRQPTALPIPD